jgi:uncharacterized protein YpmS
MKTSFYLISIIFVLITFLFLPSYAQNKEDLQNFFQENSPQILSLAHKNSTFINSDVEVVDSDESDYDYKVIVTVNYKGFIKNHTLRSYIYFEDYPRKFIWGTDTNSFSVNNGPDVVLEELKDKWSKYDY